jgi:hypothetical protein
MGISGNVDVVRLTELVEVVMPGLVPGIHVFPGLPGLATKEGVDGRGEPGHDETAFAR